MRPTLAIIIATLLESVSAHFSFVDIKSQIACNFYAKDGTDWLSLPIMEGQPFSEWWMHGQVGCQSNATGSFDLPANGRTHIVMSSRVQKVPPPYSSGSGYAPSNPDYVLTRKEWGSGPESPGNSLRGHHNIHAYTRDDTSGCALAIAYKSKAKDILPTDFVIFSVIHDCPKRQREPIDIPNLPACPNGNCICAWFWLPKTSGAKNFYMTPFVCHVTGAKANASPVDVDYAIPPRRCLDPTNCNFGPRQPAYWLGADDQRISMPEARLQPPNYSILYGFREGAQNDIFVNSNPRRHVTERIPAEQMCNGKRSRTVEPSGWTDLTSPNCRCTAKRQSNGDVRIFDESSPISTIDIGGASGPLDLVKNIDFKAGGLYFPLGKGPYRMELNNKCYLFVSDANGVVVWESMFDSGHQQKYVLSTYTGMSSDPSDWPVDGKIYTPMPTTRPTSKSTTPRPTTNSVMANPIVSKKPTLAPAAGGPPTCMVEWAECTYDWTNCCEGYKCTQIDSGGWGRCIVDTCPTMTPPTSPTNMPRTREPNAGPATQIPTNERLFDRSLTATHIATHAVGNAATTTVATPTATRTDTPITTHTPRGGHGLR
jgi:hypothetical protein